MSKKILLYLVTKTQEKNVNLMIKGFETENPCHASTFM